MATESNYSEILYTELFNTYDTVDEIWNNNGNDDEVSDATVIKLSGSTQIKYTYLTGVPLYYSSNSEPESASGEFIAISKTSDLGKAIEYILGQTSSYTTGYESFFSDVANIDFVEKTQPSSTSNDVGAITLANYNGFNSENTGRDGASGYVNGFEWDPDSTDYRGQADVWLNNKTMDDSTSAILLNLGDENFTIIMHELGHSLGLTHGDSLSSNERNTKHTIMTAGSDLGGYHPDLYYDTGVTNNAYITSLGLYDIRALQEIYGVNTSTRDESGTVYKLGQGLGRDADGDGNFTEDVNQAFIYTIWDGGGDNDKIDASDFSQGVEIDLREGHFSSIGSKGDSSNTAVAWDSGTYDAGNVAIAYGTEIEDAKGTDENDSFIGNDLDNTIYGEDGNDVFFGSLGSDDLYGGNGVDVISYDNVTAYIKVTTLDPQAYNFKVEKWYPGSDPETDPVDDTDMLYSIEMYVPSSNLTGFEMDGYGGEVIEGDENNNPSLGNSSATDPLSIFGYAGVDSLGGGSGNDFLSGGQGNDFLQGGNGNDKLLGDSENDTLYGGGGDDYLDGGAGDDTLRGDGGNDLFIHSGGNDIFIGGTAADTNTAKINTSLANITFARYGTSTDIELEISGGDTLTFQTQNLGYGIDVLELTDDDYEMKDIQVPVYGTESGETIYGSYSYLSGGVHIHVAASIDDLIYGYGGNDIINARDGANTVYGGAGNDTINGGNDSDLFYGESGDDGLNGNNGNDFLYGDAGEDTINGGNGADALFGGSNDDYLNGGADNDYLDGGAGSDEVWGGHGNDTYFYSGGNDMFTEYFGSGTDNIEMDSGITLSKLSFSKNGNNLDINVLGKGSIELNYHYGAGGKFESIEFSDSSTFDLDNVKLGTSGNDTINGTSSSDVLVGYAGDDTLDGSAGTDTVDYSASMVAVAVELNNGRVDKDRDSTWNDTLTSIENIVGTAYEDLFTGDNSANAFQGGLSDDVAYGGQGNDEIYGEDGNDDLYGEDGDDILSGGDGDDDLYGGSGTDTADYSVNTSAVNVELHNDRTDEARDSSWDDTLDSIENVIGTDYADRVIGDGSDNVVNAGFGADMVYGGVGADTLYGDGDNDALYGEHGDDVLYGGDGDDTLDGDRWNLSSGDSGNDTVYGGDGHDNIWGRHGNDILYGEDGNDILRGNEGNDTLYGGDGQDDLYGHDGDDILYGNGDHDDLFGGAGSDTFVFLEGDFDFGGTVGFDEIHDFSLAENDKLNIADLMDNYDPLNDVLTDFFNVTNNGTHSYGKIDLDGNASYDQIIKFVNVVLDNDDFTAGSNLIIA